MAQSSKKGGKGPKKKPWYPLSDVKSKISQGKYYVNPDVQSTANKDFGWDQADIVDAFSKLQRKHYHKTMPSNHKPGTMLDVYHAKGLKGEKVYTHFYIEGDHLIINSLHSRYG